MPRYYRYSEEIKLLVFNAYLLNQRRTRPLNRQYFYNYLRKAIARMFPCEKPLPGTSISLLTLLNRIKRDYLN